MNQIDQAYAGVRCRPLPFWRRVLGAVRRAFAFYASDSASAVLLAPVPDMPPVVRVAPAPGTLPTLTLGEIQRRLAPVSITARELADVFGFVHASTNGTQKLYHEADWPAIRAAIAAHVLSRGPN